MSKSNRNSGPPRTFRHRSGLWLIGLALSLIAAACTGTSDASLEAVSSTAGDAATATPVEAEPKPTATVPAPTAEAELAATADETDTPDTEALEIDAAVAANDLLANAVVIDAAGLPFTDTVNTSSATSDEDDEKLDCPAPAIDASVWYSVTPASDTRLSVSAEGSDYPAGISAATGEPGALEIIECRPFAFVVEAEAGVTYYFHVFDGESPTSPGGNLVFSVEQAAEVETTLVSELGFEGCGRSSVCKTIDVPLDYSSPNGDMTELHVTVHPATGDRIGTLFVNPGGPGGSAEQMAKELGESGPAAFSERFDIVGIDPRGTGKSRQINCNTNWEEESLVDITPDDGFADDVERILGDFADMAAVCLDTYGIEYLASVTTENAARDMETVRVLLGDEPLNYLGASYGTAIGSVYATLFPDAIRSMVLDAAVPTNPVVGDVDRSSRFEQALLRHDQVCAQWVSCPLDGISLLDAIEQVREELRTNGNIGPLERLVFEHTVGALAFVPQASVNIAQGLANALEGDGELLDNIGRSFLTPIESGGFDEYSGALVAIACADGWNLASGTAAELQPQLEATYLANPNPNAGPGFDQPCDLWPVTGPGIAAVNYTGSAPILVVGATDDAITPLDWSKQLTEELGANASLLVREGSGHVSFFASDCVTDQVVAFVLEPTPDSDATCELTGTVGFQLTSDPVQIVRVLAGSPAEIAGLQVDDRIVSADDVPIRFREDLPPGRPGEEVEVVIERDGEELSFTIKREAAPWERWRD